MDATRTLLISICASLSRLQLRLLDLSHSARATPGRGWIPAADAHWVVGDLAPPSPWLDATPPSMGIGTVISRVSTVSAHLLALIEADGEIDPRDICHLVHLLSDGTWSSATRRLAARLGVALAPSPIEERSVVWESLRTLAHPLARQLDAPPGGPLIPPSRTASGMLRTG